MRTRRQIRALSGRSVQRAGQNMAVMARITIGQVLLTIVYDPPKAVLDVPYEQLYNNIDTGIHDKLQQRRRIEGHIAYIIGRSADLMSFA